MPIESGVLPRITALTLSVWVGQLTLESGCAPVALASISCPPPTYCGLHWLRSLALPSRVLLSDLSPVTVLLVPSLSCEVAVWCWARSCVGLGSLPEAGDDVDGLLVGRRAQHVLGLLLHQKLEIPGEGWVTHTWAYLTSATKSQPCLKTLVPSTPVTHRIMP